MGQTVVCCVRCRLPRQEFTGPVVQHARRRCGTCGRWLSLSRRLARPPRERSAALACECGAVTQVPYVLSPEPPARAHVEPSFGVPLWLTTRCAGEVLWAYNGRHLGFLRDYVTASLREKSIVTGSAAQRLPRWLTAARHREAVTRGLARLFAKL
jgi:hypothetical protein